MVRSLTEQRIGQNKLVEKKTSDWIELPEVKFWRDEVNQPTEIYMESIDFPLHVFAHDPLHLETMLHALWALLLHRYSGFYQVTYGSCLYNKECDELLVYPIEVAVDEKETMETYVKVVENTLFDARKTNHIVPFSTAFICDYNIITSIEECFRHVYLKDCDLIITVEIQETKSLKINAASSKLNQHSVSHILHHYKTLVEDVLTKAVDTPLCELTILNDTEKYRVIEEFNHTEGNYPKHLCIHECFEEQVAANPDNLALSSDKEKLTYKKLNEQANQLAYILRKYNVEQNHKVALMLASCPEMIICILAILKAGGVYAPVDPSYPEARIRYMLDDIKPTVIFTRGNIKQEMLRDGVQVIDMDQVWAKLEEEDSSNLNNRIESTDAAYVNYTSGSTGQPKGVMVPHRGVIRLVKNTNYVHLNDQDRFMQIAPLSFDAATFEIWGALLNGGQLVLVDKNTVLSPTKLAKAINEYQITSMFLTSPLFNQIMDINPASLSSVHNLLVGGDSLSVVHIRNALQYVQKGAIVNGYGPTENTTFSCCYRVEDVPQSAKSIPLGPPIANSKAYILDEQMRPVPIGVIGEIYLGGDGLAKEYLNKPDKTKASFVRHPFSKKSSDRLYRTGDLGKWMLDGMIEFHGRSDDQVKIRGYRIEKGEIEEVVLTHPEILECAVLTAEDIPGYKRLICFYVSRDSLPIHVLKSWIEQKLPAYMVPSLFKQLAHFPMTSHGKINRQAILEQFHSQQHHRQTVVEQDSSYQSILTAIWCEVLHVDHVNVDDNFFDLGGDSLLIMTVQKQIEDRLQRHLSPSILLEYPTIKSITAYLNQGEEKKQTLLQQRVQKRLQMRRNKN
ncbi:non-ribosomal peptide synthetase [Chengkuizengella marina]|uniref:Amino acid adenylation domain-containing protein n=1 Tax=Chengkuizengella marina TaxID=2507566 RepID=A0A6N9Q8E1_9BACL|nr:non-ribosomal peptide synthetase [Chengkuizengella marina]NBI31089.1 amino acid adenylation domain-containing protein [Chengkuizengella marina]